ncbi:MAG: RNase adapter RapZ [Oscillospiraceae bacterium]|jgi:UPF0042 nucleotide-binding protein|nr:RNase adapter RapZ [Oscillospiraceae bacterium]
MGKGSGGEMEFIIVTGMSGAGKTQAVNALEDIGYYCVDNIPPRLITKFAELPSDSEGHISKIALVVDVRSHQLFSEYNRCLTELSNWNFPFRVLFLDCDNQSLLHRYKETRRRHPLQDDETPAIEQAIARERQLLDSAREGAGYVLDTSRLSSAQLRGRVRDLFLRDIHSAMVVNVNSFGFKRGIPSDSDLLFDVRCLPNPFYEEELKELTGLDEPVREYVLRCRQSVGLLPRLTDLIDYLIPLYIQEGKSQLVVSVGCTGGQHRSVAVSEYLAAHFAAKGISVTVNHRDMP